MIHIGALPCQADDIKVQQGDFLYSDTLDNTIATAEKVIKYHAKGILWGPFYEPLPFGKINPTFIKDETRVIQGQTIAKLRVVVDISNPKGCSYNDLITDEEKATSYPSIAHIICWIQECNIQWLAVADAKDAFHRIPIRKHHIPYFGIKIFAFYFYFTCVVLGTASACNIYNAFADMLLWILVHDNEHLFIACNGQQLVLHYLDDFLVGSSTEISCWAAYYMLTTYFRRLGVPTAPEKLAAPATKVKYIGWIIDIPNQTLGIPDYKIAKAINQAESLLKVIQHAKKLPAQRIFSFLGYIRHLCTICIYLKAALRSLEAKVARVRHRHHYIRLTAQDKVHIHLIIAVLHNKSWHAIPFDWLTYSVAKTHITYSTDASTTIGIGGCREDGEGSYFSLNFSNLPGWSDLSQIKPDIHYLELLAVIAWAQLRAHTWTGKIITVYCDNMPAVRIVIKKRACFARFDLQTLCAILCELGTKYKFFLHILHRKGIENTCADALSRGQPLKAINEAAFELNNDCSIQMAKVVTKDLAIYKNDVKRMNRSHICDCEDSDFCIVQRHTYYNKRK